MLYFTGDIHADLEALLERARPLTAEDYLLVCGDLGLVWSGTKREELRLDLLDGEVQCTVLFVCGNHENYDLLAAYPKRQWNGGLVQCIRPHLLHLMRGQVFNICGRTVFTMGGARSHDISDGILQKNDPELDRKCSELDARFGFYRIEHVSWWRQELPSAAEMAAGLSALSRQHWQVDLIVTHCLPTSVQQRFGADLYEPDRLTNYFEFVRRRTKFTMWFCGHYHHDALHQGKYQVLYKKVVPAPAPPPEPYRARPKGAVPPAPPSAPTV